MFRTLWPVPVLTALLASLGGCVNTPLPALPQDALPASWPAEQALGPAPDLQQWWRQFSDPVLDRLVDQALAGNLTLAEAGSRIKAARILLGNVDKSFLPELHATTQGVQSPNATDSFFQFGLDASWELPLFGRKQARNRLAEAALQTAEVEARSARVSVVAEVVRSYIELRTAQRQLALQQQLQGLAQERVRLLGERVRLGLAPASALIQAETQLNADSSSLPEREQDIGQAEWRLALLLGQPQPDPALAQSAAQPVLAPFAFQTLPADLLRTRPEIQGAEAGVLQAAGELGVARADLYPYITLGGSFYYAANVTQNFVRDGDFHGTPSLAPNLDLPLFDWGRRRAVVRAQKLELDAALTGYRQAVLEAVSEVQSALLTLHEQQARVAQEQLALTGAGHSNEASQTLQRVGLASPLDALAGQQQQAQAQLDLAAAEAGHDLAYIALYKALGGAALPAGTGG